MDITKRQIQVVLIDIKALIKKKKNWFQIEDDFDHYARDAADEECFADAPTAVKWTLQGAVWKCVHNLKVAEKTEDLFNAAIHDHLCEMLDIGRLDDFNNMVTHKKVLKMLNRAIARCNEEKARSAGFDVKEVQWDGYVH